MIRLKTVDYQTRFGSQPDSLLVSDDSQTDCSNYGNLVNPMEISDDFKDYVNYQEDNFNVVYDSKEDENIYFKNKARGTNKHLGHLISKINSIKESVQEFDGRITFLTLTLNHNCVSNVFENIRILKRIRGDLLPILRRDFPSHQFLWVWELHESDGFVHLHIISLGKIPYDYLNSSKQKEDWVGYEWNRPHTEREGSCLNEWYQRQHFSIKSNSLDWEQVYGRVGKKKVQNYLVDYLCKQQGYFADYGHSKGDGLDKTQKAYWLGILRIMSLRSFGYSQGLYKGTHKSNCSNGRYEYIGTMSRKILDTLGAFKDKPPPPDETNSAIEDLWSIRCSSSDSVSSELIDEN